MLIPFDTLFKKYNIAPDGVLHLGANEGQEAEAYAAQGIKRVIWIEALPGVFNKLKRHIAKFPGHSALCACVSDVDGQTVHFNIASNQGQSSSFLEFGTHSEEHPTVKFIGGVRLQTTRVDTLFHRLGIMLEGNWFLNVDLQGAELLALRGMGALLSQFTDAYIEVNERELYKGCPLVAEIDKFLEGFGLFPRECKMTGSGWGDKYYSV